MPSPSRSAIVIGISQLGQLATLWRALQLEDDLPAEYRKTLRWFLGSTILLFLGVAMSSVVALPVASGRGRSEPARRVVEDERCTAASSPVTVLRSRPAHVGTHPPREGSDGPKDARRTPSAVCRLLPRFDRVRDEARKRQDRKEWAASWVFGLVPPEPIEAQSKCTTGVSKVETEHSFLNALVAFFTIQIYTPMHLTVTCAAGPTADVPEPETPPSVASAP